MTKIESNELREKNYQVLEKLVRHFESSIFVARMRVIDNNSKAIFHAACKVYVENNNSVSFSFLNGWDKRYYLTSSNINNMSFNLEDCKMESTFVKWDNSVDGNLETNLTYDTAAFKINPLYSDSELEFKSTRYFEGGKYLEGSF
ncbi:hypothetical protein GFV16_11370 [Bacillus megaterium]|uniref:hypothetical protein n=1 Tax=Priestia megaterium TaxID=1404 RepID=UPI001292F209|nr:hypothetical protein [Priestia megaterium]MQR86511.1 hypothetical protein [Priestia megaterium]